MTPPKKRRGRVTAPNVLGLAHLVRLLQDGTRDSWELAAECGLSRLTVQSYCRALRQVGAAHICMWEQDQRGAHTIMIYKLGPGADAKRPALPRNFHRDNRRKALGVIAVSRALVQPELQGA